MCYLISSLAMFSLFSLFCSALPLPSQPAKIAVVNFKTCIDKSKVGKEEQESFEGLKKQMEQTVEEKEKVLGEIANKFNDPDYLDSLSPEAETELKRKFRSLSTELNQQQNQFYQVLQQTNLKVIQKLNEAVAKATKEVAEKNKIDLVANEESSFYYTPALDISQDVILVMDAHFESEQKAADEAKPGETK